MTLSNILLLLLLLLLSLLNIFDDVLLGLCRRVTAESWARAVTWKVSEM